MSLTGTVRVMSDAYMGNSRAASTTTILHLSWSGCYRSSAVLSISRLSHDGRIHDPRSQHSPSAFGDDAGDGALFLARMLDFIMANCACTVGCFVKQRQFCVFRFTQLMDGRAYICEGRNAGDA